MRKWLRRGIWTLVILAASNLVAAANLLTSFYWGTDWLLPAAVDCWLC